MFVQCYSWVKGRARDSGVPDNLALAVIRILPSVESITSATQPRTISELNPRGPLPRCLRFNPGQSPDQRQGSLPACPLRL